MPVKITTEKSLVKEKKREPYINRQQEVFYDKRAIIETFLDHLKIEFNIRLFVAHKVCIHSTFQK